MEDRIRRYKDKMSYIVRNMEAVELQPESELELSGVFYKLHTSIEAAMDIVSMLLKDMGEDVGNDYTNIMRLKDLKIITAELSDELAKCNGLRNHLVHRYDKIDDTIAIKSIPEIHDIVYQFIEITERLFDEIGQDKK